MTKYPYGLYSMLNNQETLVWVFPSANEAFAAFGIGGSNTTEYHRTRRQIQESGSYSKGPNCIRQIKGATFTAFKQDSQRLPAVLKCIAEQNPILYQEYSSLSPREVVLAERAAAGKRFNANGPMGVFLIEGDELVWKFPSARSCYAAIGLGGTTSNKKGNRVRDLGGGKILRPPYYVRDLLTDEIAAFGVNEEDREEEILDGLAKGIVVHRGEDVPRIKCSTATCTRGFLEYTADNFRMNDKDHPRRCHDCQRVLQAKTDAKHQTEKEAAAARCDTHFDCRNCNKHTPMEEKESDRWWCRSCRIRTLLPGYDETNVSEGSPCTRCGNQFDRATFRFRADFVRGGWRPLCRTCIDDDAKTINLRFRLDADRRIAFIQRCAKTRSIFFRTSDLPEMRALLFLPCAYCGWHANDSLNGLDRVNNTGGYHMGNVVPCCPTCNLMKGDMSVSQLLTHATSIINFQTRSGGAALEARPTAILSSWMHGKSAWGRKAGYTHREATTEDCYLCGIETTCGLDRVDSLQTYTTDANTKPCCWKCNRMKRDLSLDNFLSHLAAMVANPSSLDEYLDEEDSIIPRSETDGSINDVSVNDRKRKTRIPRKYGIIVYDQDEIVVGKWPTRAHLVNEQDASTGKFNQLLLETPTENPDEIILNNRWRICKAFREVFVVTVVNAPRAVIASFETDLLNRLGTSRVKRKASHE